MSALVSRCLLSFFNSVSHKCVWSHRLKRHLYTDVLRHSRQPEKHKAVPVGCRWCGSSSSSSSSRPRCLKAAVLPWRMDTLCMDACTYVPDMQPAACLNRLWPNDTPASITRDSTLHRAAVWLCCITRRLLEAPAHGRPHDVIVSRHLRHLFADLDPAVRFTLTCVVHTTVSNWRFLRFRVPFGHVLTARSGTSTVAMAERRAGRSFSRWQRAILWLSRGV